jgi:hypothetical protein
MRQLNVFFLTSGINHQLALKVEAGYCWWCSSLGCCYLQVLPNSASDDWDRESERKNLDLEEEEESHGRE